MDGPTKRTINVLDTSLTVISFVDRRHATPQEGEFIAQYQLESLLFGQHMNTTGAVYRLLKRAGVGSRALALRRASVAQGLLSDEEFDGLKELLEANWLRSFTLVPLDAIQAAVTTFGPSSQSTALLSALGMPWPIEWEESSSSGGGRLAVRPSAAHA